MKGWSDIKKNLSKIGNHLFFIVLLLCFSVVSTSLITFYFITPQYEASTDILIHQKAAEEEGLTRDGLRENLQFIPTFKEIATSPVLLQRASEKFNLNMTAEELRGNISIQTLGDSQVAKIAVTHEDPDIAAAVANELVELAKAEIRALINLDNIIILAPATEGEAVSGGAGDIIFNMAAAALMSVISGIGIAFFVEHFDRTIKDEHDVAEVLGLPVLGVISSNERQKEGKKFKPAVSGKFMDRKSAEKSI